MVCVNFMSAQNHWNVTPTDASHHIMIPATVEDPQFEIGDLIGVFNTTGEDKICVGFTEWTGENIAVPAFGASFSIPGLISGQEMFLYHWNANLETETELFPVYNTQDFPNTSTFSVDGLSGVSNFITEHIPGCKDNSASNYNPTATLDNGSCISFEQLTIDSLKLVITENQQVYSDSLESLHEYIRKFDFETNFSAGWNIFAFSCPDTINTSLALSEYADKIIAVKDHRGFIYAPEYDFNEIDYLNPGVGYQVKFKAPVQGFNLCGNNINQFLQSK